MKLYAGSSNNPLALKVADKLGIEVGDVELSLFANNECRIWVKDEVPEKVIILQSFSNPVDHHIIEFCLLADALKRKGATEIIAIIPWMGYSKQDKVFRKGEPLSVSIIAKIIQTTTIKKFITLDLHNASVMEFFESPLENVQAAPLFISMLSSKKNREDFMVVSPDAGAVKNSIKFAQALDIPIAYLNKKRDLHTGEVSILDIDKDVAEKDLIIVDDMIVTGSTLLSAAAYLKENKAKSVSVVATHHLFLDGVQDKLDQSQIDLMLITDSISMPSNITSGKIEITSIDSLIAQSI